MSAPYRSEVPALESKKEAIERELDDLHGRRDARQHALGLARQVEQELAVALDAVTPLEPTPLLDRVRVAKPCPVSWASMRGDDVTRFCGSCRKHVHDLSAMTRGEAEAFLGAQREANPACVTFYRRLDGTVVSEDCPSGAGAGTTRRKKLLVFATVAAAAAALTSSSVRERLLGDHVVRTTGAVVPTSLE